ncbi:hypothetical protein PROFUN_16753, partial [Planoprotostelium fungivorum]
MDFATVQERDHKNICTPSKTMAQPFKEKPSYREPCPLPNHTHPKSECRELKRQERSNFSSPTQPSDTQTKRTFDINSVTCNYCLDKGHYANKCPKRTTTQPSNQPDKPKDSKLRAIRSKPPAETAEEASDYSAVDTYVASMVPGYRLRSLHVDPLNTQRFHVPILINNIRFRALLDSGADGSYINRKTAEAHNIPWTPTPGRVTLAGEGQAMDRYGLTDPLATMAQPFKEKPSYREPCPLPNHTHPKSECRELKRQERSNFSSPTQPSDTQTKRTFDINSVTCNYCLDKGHYANKCPKRTTTQPSNQPDKPKDSKLRAIRSKPPAETAEEASDYSAVNTYVASMVPGYRLRSLHVDPLNTQRFHVPILINNIRFRALLDSGADGSYINRKTAEAHNIPWTPTPGRVTLAGEGQAMDRYGLTDPLAVQYGNPGNVSNCLLTFHVVDLEGPEIFIGGDNFHLINVSVTNLATKWPTDKPSTLNTTVIVPELDSDTNDAAFPLEEHKLFMEQIKPALDANAALPATAICTLPEAIINIETPEGYASYRPQYKIPERQKPAVDAQINKWIEQVVLRDAPVDIRWNNALLTVPKPDGRVRVCIDPRPINMVSQDDKYPLPDANELLRRMKGACIFSTLDCMTHLIDYCTIFGFPRILQSDNGTEFVNELMKLLKETAGFDHRLITPYHAAANEHKLFMEQIKPALDANAALPATAICTLPEAIINIETLEGYASYRPQYKIPERQKPAVDAQINKWIEQVVIRDAPVDIRWNNALLTVSKPDGRVRVCIDPRPINMVSQDDKYPLPDANELLCRMKGACIFSTLDCTDAYHSLPIAEKDQHKTAFTWNGKMYVFVRAPFGFKQIPGKFQRVMHIIFRNTHFVIIYMDDITVYSFNLEHHSEHVCHTINLLTENGFRLNITKYKWALTRITFLGHIVDAVGSRVNPAKLADCENWPKPTTGKHIQQFLGFVNYWRDNIPLLSSLTSRLDALRNEKDITHLWTIDHDEDYNRILAILRSGTMLHHADFNYPFFGASDASGTGIGGCVYQIIEGTTRYVLFCSRSLTPAERNYSATKRELLALIYNGFRLNITKCKWALTRITFLGHIVDAVGSRVNPAKLADCENWPKPTTGKHIQQFLGFVNYWRDNIPLLSSLTSRLDALRNEKDITHLWTIDHDEDYNRILAILRSGTMLHHADFNYPFFGASDASGTGIGGCVYQIIEGTTRYVLFCSRSLTPAERNYSATKRELLALIY